MLQIYLEIRMIHKKQIRADNYFPPLKKWYEKLTPWLLIILIGIQICLN